MSDPARNAPAVSTDEWIDRALSRPAAQGIVALLRHTPVTPNQVTVLAGLSGIAAGFGIANGTPLSLVLAAVGMLGVLVLDCADGQLARIRGGGSRLGRLLDGACDYVTAGAAHIGAVVYLVRTNPGIPELPTWAEVALVFAAGILLAIRSGIYDDLKGRVRRLTGAGKDERDEPEEVRAELRAERRPLVRLFLRAYLVYCRIQTRPGGEGRGRGGEPTEERVRFLTRVYRAWSFLGPSTHMVALAAAVALAARWPDAIRWFFLASVGPGLLVMLALLPVTARARRD